MNRIKAYVGFAFKKKSVLIGVDNIKKFRRNVDLILFSEDLSENSKKQLLNTDFAKYELKREQFAEIVTKSDIKAIAIVDKNLANEIIKNLSGGV